MRAVHATLVVTLLVMVASAWTARRDYQQRIAWANRLFTERA